ncbi:OmpP1/FadL family transporter [Roseovarius ramblicola]|uniref:OmpP1/FadL family transporter n=1 Tax=Roseovarius ramblicola TaxID=2022336 RepID=A0ABV5I1F3_9RHOB
MKQSVIAMTLLATASAPAFAGGIERRGDPSQILFEEGQNYVEFSVTSVDPDVSGKARPGTGGAPFGATGDIQDRYQNYALGYKRQLNDRVALAFVIDEPVGADVTYRGPVAFGGGPFFGTSNASVESIRYTGMAKFKATDRFSVYGGLSYVGLSGSLLVVSPGTGGVTPTNPPPVPPQAQGGPREGRYSLAVNKDFQVGYMFGAAYEIPDIALRVALTYESETEHEFDDNTGSPFEVELPKSLTLHAQSGIAKNTLLFGSVRWREWSEFQVAPEDFFSFSTGSPVTTPIAFGTEDIYTYRLGIGRRFTQNWSGAFILGYEEQTGNQVGNLEGTDGFLSYTAAVTHTMERLEVTGALSYIDLDDADTSVASFSGNDGFAFGLKVGMKF